MGPAGEADADTSRAVVALPVLRATVRRSLVDPGRARSVERLEPGRELLPYRDLSDWLSTRAGASVRGYGGGGRQVLSIRGARPAGVLVLLDGLPLNDPLTGEADLSSVPLSSLESATLVRGAGAARYGSGALGGALLLESSAAGADDPAGRVALGSHGAYELSGSAGWRAGSPDDDAAGSAASIDLGGGVRGAENDFVHVNRLAAGAPAVRRENADFRTRWIELAARAGPGRVTLRTDDLDRGVPGRLGTNLFAGDRWHRTRQALTGGASWSNANLRAGLRRLAMRYEPAADAGGDSGGGSGDSPASEQTALDARLGGEVVLPTLADLVVGGRLTMERLEGDGIGGTPERIGAGLTLRRSFEFPDRPRSPGPDAVPGSELGFEPMVSIDVTDSETVVSPEVGAWWRPAEALRLYGRVGRGYRLPTFADLHFEAAPGVRATPDLQAERIVVDAELGAELSTPVAGTRGSLHVDVWSRRTDRPIVWIASSAAIWSPRNLDRLAARGIDVRARLEGRARRRTADAAETGWGLEAGLSLQRSRVGFGSNRNPLPYQPDVGAHAAAELRRGRAALRLEATYTGSRTTTLAATRRLSGFTTLDAGLRHRFTPGPLILDVSAGVENLFDRRYELVELFPEPGRSLRLTLDVRGPS